MVGMLFSLPALDLVRQLAERADRPRGHLAAPHALVQRDRLGALEGRARPIEEAEQEVVLRPGRGVLHAAQDLLVRDRGGALGERAFLDDVVDLPQEGERRRLALGEPVEGLYPPHQLGMGRRQRGRLARQRVGLPVHDRAEERRRLVVEVVAGRDHRDAVLERHAIHQVALGQAAAGARRPARDLLDDRHRSAHLVAHGADDQRHAAGRGERLALGLRLDRVVEDAEVEIEAGRPVALVDQHVPEGERVLAAGHGHQHRLVAREHPVLADRLADLVTEELEEVRGAERGVVAAQLEDGRLPALAALHREPALPPDMTGRSSIVSPSRTTWSAVTRSSPQITRTVSGMMSSSRRMSLTRRLPATSTSRRGLRRMTFTSLRSRPWKSGRALDLANLYQVDAVVMGLQLPPLREIELAEPEVLELQRTRVERRELLDRLAAALAGGAHRREELGDRPAT